MSEARGNSKAGMQAIRVAIGQRLRLVRERLGESQAKFAARLGVAKLSVLTYESGGRCPGADQLWLLSDSGLDASFVAFGVPSLATPESRRQFASALAWVRNECAAPAAQVSEADLVEAAWLVFCELRKHPSALAPEEAELQQMARDALKSLPH